MKNIFISRHTSKVLCIYGPQSDYQNFCSHISRRSLMMSVTNWPLTYYFNALWSISETCHHGRHISIICSLQIHMLQEHYFCTTLFYKEKFWSIFTLIFSQIGSELVASAKVSKAIVARQLNWFTKKTMCENCRINIILTAKKNWWTHVSLALWNTALFQALQNTSILMYKIFSLSLMLK